MYVVSELLKRVTYLSKLEELADVLRDKLHFSLTADDKQEAIQRLQTNTRNVKETAYNNNMKNSMAHKCSEVRAQRCINTKRLNNLEIFI